MKRMLIESLLEINEKKKIRTILSEKYMIVTMSGWTPPIQYMCSKEIEYEPSIYGDVIDYNQRINWYELVFFL